MAPAVWEAEHIYLFINTKNQMWIEFNRLGFFFFLSFLCYTKDDAFTLRVSKAEFALFLK